MRGPVALALAAQHNGVRALLLPRANLQEVLLVESLLLWPAKSLTEAVALLQHPPAPGLQPRLDHAEQRACTGCDLASVQGQLHGRRALESPPPEFITCCC